MALYFDLLRDVILKTPVDTGRARGGWGAGAEAVGIRVPAKQGHAEGRARSEFSAAKRGNAVRLVTTNRVDYIEHLEAGTSTQAPFGMVRLAYRELEMRLGGRRLPKGIEKILQAAWDRLGLKRGTSLRAGQIAEGAGLTEGANVGADR